MPAADCDVFGMQTMQRLKQERMMVDERNDSSQAIAGMAGGHIDLDLSWHS